jgi:hypothetical protein
MITNNEYKKFLECMWKFKSGKDENLFKNLITRKGELECEKSYLKFSKHEIDNSFEYLEKSLAEIDNEFKDILNIKESEKNK